MALTDKDGHVGVLNKPDREGEEPEDDIGLDVRTCLD